MVIHRLPLTSHPWLVRLHEAMAVAWPAVAAGPQPRPTSGWPEALGAGPPAQDLDVDAPRFALHLVALQRSIQLAEPATEVRAAWYYPAGGGLGWHTNSGRPGWRMYVVHLPVEYPVSGIVTVDGCYPDRRGFVNFFKITDWQRSWHAVYAATPRLSVGVLLADDDPIVAQIVAR